MPARNGKPQWQGRVVPRYEATRRLAAHKPVVDQSPPADGQFLFSLASGDLIELRQDGSCLLYVVRTVSRNKTGYIGVEYVHNNDARKKGDIKKPAKRRQEGEDQAWFTAALNALAERGCKKVIVTPLGEVRYAND